MTDRRQKIERLTRLIDLRQLSVDAREREFRQAEQRLTRIEAGLAEERGNFDRLRADFSQLHTRTGLGLRQTEVAIEVSIRRQERLLQDVEKAKGWLEQARGRWMEARRERKVVEKLRERQLHHAQREMDYRSQQATDEAAITRHWRTEFDESSDVGKP